MNDVVLSVVSSLHGRALQAGAGIGMDSGPVAPPGVEGKVDTLLGWGKYACYAACAFGIIFVAARLAISNRRGESDDHAKGLAAVMVAAILAGAGGGIIQALQ